MIFRPTVALGDGQFCCADCSRTPEEFFLTEVSPKDQIWDYRKDQSKKLGDLYRGTSYDSYAGRIDECAGYLKFDWVVDPETGEIHLKLKAARFCRVRHCPVCQWRKSLMWVARFLKAVPLIQADYPTARFVFLTLTVKNCPITELRETITHMNKSWQRLSQKKKFPAIGFARSTEVTRAKDDLAHPHFHCVLMVKSTYFNRDYLNQKEWTELWQKALRVEYIPIAHVRNVRANKSREPGLEGIDSALEGFTASLVETLKYSVKPDDLLGQGRDEETNRRWLTELTKQLHKTRSVSLGGVFKNYLSEEEPEDLIDGDLEEEELVGEVLQVWFGWRESHRKYVKQYSSD